MKCSDGMQLSFTDQSPPILQQQQQELRKIMFHRSSITRQRFFLKAIKNSYFAKKNKFNDVQSVKDSDKSTAYLASAH